MQLSSSTILSNPLSVQIINKFKNREFVPYQRIDKPIGPFGRDLSKYKGSYNLFGFYEDAIEQNMMSGLNPVVAKSYDKKYGLSRTMDFVALVNILWYINKGYDTSKNNILLTKEEVKYISELSEQELLSLISYIPNYKGVREQGSIIFALMFGIFIPYFELPPRYQKVKYYDGVMVWSLADNVYHIQQNSQNILPPYIYISFFEPTLIENLMSSVTRENLHIIASKYGIVKPGGTVNTKYVVSELSRYGPILSRDDNIQLPEILSNNFDEAKQQLAPFTSLEIGSYYWLLHKITSWGDFNLLVLSSIRVLSEPPQWSLTMNYGCWHDHNKQTRENLSEEDLFIAYGYYNNYICYRVSDLRDEWEYNISNGLDAQVPRFHLQPSNIGIIGQTFDKEALIKLWNILIDLPDSEYKSLLPLLEMFINEYNKKF